MLISWLKILKLDITEKQLIKPKIIRKKCGNILINLLAGVQNQQIYRTLISMVTVHQETQYLKILRIW